MRGWCRCPAGWTGDDCSTRMRVSWRPLPLLPLLLLSLLPLLPLSGDLE